VGLSSSDLIGSAIMLHTGILRTTYTMLDMTKLTTSRLNCFLKMALAWIMATEMTSILMVASSLDRYFVHRVLFNKLLIIKIGCCLLGKVVSCDTYPN